MDMIPVDSEAVSAIGYDGSSLHLTWRSNGKTSVHPGVPEWKHTELMQAASKGKYIAKHIRKQHPGVVG
jgi:hypothetical protein